MNIGNYYNVRENIIQSCAKSGRNPKEITLIAVSKTKPADDIIKVYDTGQRDFGENKVQEMTAKKDILPDDINWHLIGHLQTNKVKYIVGRTKMIHSVDSVKLARAISKEALKRGISVDILIEINIAEEESKYGIKASESINLIKDISNLPGIHVCGLMTVAPYVEDPELNRPLFRNLKQLSVDIQSKNIDNVSMSVLSMGMTNDYTVAIEEGATHIRVGTAIFGERQYSKREN